MLIKITCRLLNFLRNIYVGGGRFSWLSEHILKNIIVKEANFLGFGNFLNFFGGGGGGRFPFTQVETVS